MLEVADLGGAIVVKVNNCSTFNRRQYCKLQYANGKVSEWSGCAASSVLSPGGSYILRIVEHHPIQADEEILPQSQLVDDRKALRCQTVNQSPQGTQSPT